MVIVRDGLLLLRDPILLQPRLCTTRVQEFNDKKAKDVVDKLKDQGMMTVHKKMVSSRSVPHFGIASLTGRRGS